MVVYVHPRVFAKRPEIAKADVLAAFDVAVLSQVRANTTPTQCFGIGLDSTGRVLEWVAVRTGGDGWLIYHCMPATKKMLKELGLSGRGRLR